ncbi:PAAR domain-containing protein [Paraburkholderia sp. IMGN_8]|uniref:PAAR domain-containing protein n=1 Tax=Paraburkholderia sp. IMGN_8 TaxID=3136564 RepID=UPI003100DCF4
MNNEQKALTHLFATIGATTGRGGRVTRVSTTATIHDKGLAVVGDIVTYDDGTEATIIDGAGFAATWADKPVALVGSRLSNGDRITAAQHDFGITVHEGEQIPGLFDPAWTPLRDPAHEGEEHA